MKKTLIRFCSTLIFSFIVSIFCFTNVEASSVDNIANAIQKTMDSELSAQIEANLSYGESKLTLDTIYRQNKNRIKEEDSIKIHVNFKDIPDPDEAFPGTLDFNLKTVFTHDIEDQLYYFLIDDLIINLDIEDKLTEQIVGGFSEMFKHILGKTYEMDLNSIQESIKNGIKEISGSYSDGDLEKLNAIFYSIKSHIKARDKIGILWKVFLESGIFEVNQDGKIYTITLAKNPEIANMKDIMQALLEAKIFPPEINEEITREMEYLDADEIENIRIQSQSAFAEVKDMFDIEIKLTIIDGRVTQSSSKILFTPKGMLKEAIPFLQDIVLKSSGVFSYNPQTINLPKASKHTINITKFVKAIIAIGILNEKNYQSEMQKWEKIEKETKYNNRARINEKRNELLQDKELYPWYMEYIYNIEQSLDVVLNAEKKVTMRKLFEVLDALIRYNVEDHGYHGGYLCDYTEYTFDTNVSSVYYRINGGIVNECMNINPDTLVRRGKGLQTIILAMFPNENYPLKFAVEKGFVTGAYTKGKNKYKIMNQAEIAKIMSEIIDYYWEF